MKKKKTRRNRKAQVRIPFPVMLANVLVFVAVIGLSYVWLCARCEMLGREIKHLETTQRETRRRLVNERDRWENLLAPANFERTLKRHGLAMVLPDERQIVRVRHDGSNEDALTIAFHKQNTGRLYE